MRGILYRYRVPLQDAEDLVQKALLAMIARWDEIKVPDAWLCGALEAAGERRLLEGLSRLRLAFAAQQQRTLGRTVWRAQWTETPAPG